jgi:hypothetical protein
MTFSGARTAILAAPALVMVLSGAASGQTAALQQRLAHATSVTCSFSLMATGTWKDGVAAGEIKATQIKVSFTNVNVDEGTADADSAFGGSFIVVRQSNDYLHLMQMHSSGPLYTTTVLAKETKDGRLMAIHTRHEYTDVRLPGFTSRPEMYLGDCLVGS